MVQWVKNLPAVQGMPEIRVGVLSQEDPLEEGMQPTLVFLPGESHGQRSLVNCSPLVAKSQTRLRQLSTHGTYVKVGFPGGTSGEEPSCQCRR